MKRLTRVFSIVTVLMMLACAVVGFAEESDVQTYQTILLSEMDTNAATWLETTESRALFAAIMTVEMYSPEDLGMSALIETYGLPTIYLTQLKAFEGEDVTMVMHFIDGNFELFVTYLDSLGTYFVSRIESDFSLVSAEDFMSAYVEGDVIGNYYVVELSDYANAVNQLSEIFNQ